MNKDGLMAAMCTTCSHKKVCSLKAEFLEAQKAVNNLYISRPCNEKHKVSMIALEDFKFIKPIELECIHYEKTKEVVFR